MVHKIGVHPCPDCTKTFSRLEYVARHRRLKHLGLRSWRCECGSSYARSDLLARHKRKCEAKCSEPSGTYSKDLKITPASASDYHPSPAAIIAPTQQPWDRRETEHRPPPYPETVFHQAPDTSTLRPPAPLGLSAPLPKNLTSSSSNFLTEPQDPTEKTRARSTSYAHHHVDQIHALDCPEKPKPAADGATFQHREVGGEDDDPVQVQTSPAELSALGDPISSFIPYIHETFFINDVPESSPYYLNPDIWVLAFLCQRSQGFTIPHLGTLSRFVSRAMQVICPVIPMIHVPTFKTTLITIHLGYALSVAGAASETSDYALAFTDQSLTYKRSLVQNDFLSRKNGINFRFELFQALLIYQFIGMFSRLESQRNRSIVFSQTIVENFRDLGFIEELRNAPDYIHLVLSGQVSLDLGWRLWVNYEVQKRSAFLVLISSLQLRGFWEGGLTLAEADLPLPCHEDLWMARSAGEWLGVVAGSGRSAGKGPHTVAPPSIPLLSEALAALDLSADSRCLIPDILHLRHRASAPAHRLGGFARTVIHHSRPLANQATVRTAGPKLDPAV